MCGSRAMTDGRARLFSPVQAKRLHHLLIALTLLGTLGVLVHDYSDEPRLGIEGRLGLDVPASALQRDFRIHFASFADCSSAARFDIISRQARVFSGRPLPQSGGNEPPTPSLPRRHNAAAALSQAPANPRPPFPESHPPPHLTGPPLGPL